MTLPQTSKLRLPRWTAHPGFGILALLLLAIFLIWRGEPQPSSRPSGTSVAVSGTSSAATGSVPALLVVRSDRLEELKGQNHRVIPLPGEARPESLMTSKGLTVVLAVVGDRQRAYGITPKLAVLDLGAADAVLPSVRGDAAVIVESALVDPGLVTPSPGSTASGTVSSSATARSSGSPPKQPELRDFVIRRFDATGRIVQSATLLPDGFRAAVDTSVGLTVWQPVNRVFDAGLEQESLSAAARLIRPDGSERELGPVHPLASTANQLLVWDVAVRRFGLMPLHYATSTATSTASPSVSASASRTKSTSDSASSSPSPTPTVVPGTRWFLPTRGMLLVTGPAAFNSDASAFAVYAQVGARRRLVVAELKNVGTDQVEVLVLAQPPAKSPSAAVPSGTGPLISPSPRGSSSSASATESPTSPVVAPDGFPISAPLAPVWWNGTVVAVGLDSTVIGYRPGSTLSAELDLGLTDVTALALAP